MSGLPTRNVASVVLPSMRSGQLRLQFQRDIVAGIDDAAQPGDFHRLGFDHPAVLVDVTLVVSLSAVGLGG